MLRIEDTDRQRSTAAATDLIFESLSWLGIDFDDEPIYQSERLELYQERVQYLIDQGYAYYCDCSKERIDALRAEQIKKKLKPRYDNKCRNRQLEPRKGDRCVVRFKNPLTGSVRVDDMVQGKVVYKNSELDDLIIQRADGTPTYNFAVVVDEIDMAISHVIRGDDHLNNTPRQINLYHAFNHPIPQFGHVPLLLSPQGKKLSKRENAVSVLTFKEAGYLPQAILNYMVRLGWSHGDQELFTIEDMKSLFDAGDINRSPASLDDRKIQWINHQHMMKLDSKQAAVLAKPYFSEQGLKLSSKSPSLEAIFDVQKQRSKTFIALVEGSRYFYEDTIVYEDKAARKFLTSESCALLVELKDDLVNLPDWEKDSIHAVIKSIVDRHGIKFGGIAQPVRVALTGGTVSPGIDVTIELIGRERTVSRLEQAIAWVQNQVKD